jgi:D-threo-aldose 1-dehydrogenase
MNNTSTGIRQANKVLDLNLPTIIFGTSGLGNLFVVLDDVSKCDIIKECITLSKDFPVFDTAGKYGAGLALEVLGKCLKQLNVHPDNVVISNKLGWVRTELKTEEPTFEPGVWKDLKYDAVQKISYNGIVECFEQGNQLLGGYIPRMVSVHDPDEYIAKASNEQEAQQLYQDILDAYKALSDLKQEGKVKAIGVGAKDWKIIQRIAGDVSLDWVMIANSMTIKNHPTDLLQFISDLNKRGVAIINSAVFHSGFLTGGDYFDYKQVKPGTYRDDALLRWREQFFSLCSRYNIKPAAACVQFALRVPGVRSIALNTSEVKRVKENLQLADVEIPDEFWEAMKAEGLIEIAFLDKTEVIL